MPQLSDKISNKKWTVLGIGSPGVGKTPALLSIAEKGEVKIFDFDDRLDSTKEFYTKICPRPNIIKNIDYMVVGMHNFQTFMEEWEKLQDYCPYYAVMLDSVSSMSVTSIAWQIRMKIGGKGVQVKLSGGKTGIPVPDWPEFNGEANLLCSTFEVGKAIPAHFIVTAHPMNRTAVEASGSTIKGAKKYTSLVSAGVKGVDLVPNYFNEIWKFEIDTDYSSGSRAEKHVIHTKKITSDDLAKTTCGLPEVVDFTGKPLFEVIEGLLNKEAAG